MKVKQFNDNFIVRLDPDEEIVESIKKICNEHKIKFGSIRGIGAVYNVVLGYYNPKTKKFFKKEFKDEFSYEITSLTGNITIMNKEIYIHLHINMGDSDYNVIGGHLVSAFIRTTGEIIINSIKGQVDRINDEEMGLNLFNL